MWRQFEAEFELKARRVGDITDREKEDKIKRELPDELRRRLGEENLRVSATKFWVKNSRPCADPSGSAVNPPRQAYWSNRSSTGEELLGLFSGLWVEGKC